jgi:hypothetical protein
MADEARIRRLVREMDNLISHIEGINDERDSVPILLALRERWPLLREILVKVAKNC